MKAFILAAGFGKRMGELTRDLPKPLLPVNGRPLLDYTLFQLYRWKCELAVINVHYLGDAIATHLEDFPYFPIRVSREDEILGTAGGLRNALSLLDGDDPVIMINPDMIFFAHAWDRPEIARKAFQPGTAACLYLAEKPKDSTERGWVFDSADAKVLSPPACDAQDTRPIRHEKSGGRYLYNGFSIINPSSVVQLQPGKFEEFGPMWVDQADRGLVLGKVYKGHALDAGTRDPYDRLRNREVVPRELRDEWEHFKTGWPARNPQA